MQILQVTLCVTTDKSGDVVFLKKYRSGESR